MARSGGSKLIRGSVVRGGGGLNLDAGEDACHRLLQQIEKTPSKPKGAKDKNAEWNKFFERASRTRRFKDLIAGSCSKSASEDAFRLSWDLCKEDIERIQRRLDDLNLNSLQQVQVLKQLMGKGSRALSEADLIEFYDPVRYLTQTTREIVRLIVADQMRQLGPGGKHYEDPEEYDPNWEEVKGEEAADLAPSADYRDEELERRQKQHDEHHAAMKRVAELEIEMEAAARREQEYAQLALHAAHTESVMVGLQDEVEKLEREKEFHKMRAQDLEEEVDRVRTILDGVVAELEVAKQEIEKLDVRCKAVEAKLFVTEGRLTKALENLRRAEEEREALRKRTKELEEKLQKAIKRAQTAEAEAAEIRAELARRNNTKTVSVQTSLGGAQVADLQSDNKRQKIMIENLRCKVGDFATDMKRLGHTEDVDQVFAKHGLDKLMSARSCFERLFADASEREHRRAHLTQKFRKDHTWRSGLDDDDEPMETARRSVLHPSVITPLFERLWPEESEDKSCSVSLGWSPCGSLFGETPRLMSRLELEQSGLILRDREANCATAKPSKPGTAGDCKRASHVGTGTDGLWTSTPVPRAQTAPHAPPKRTLPPLQSLGSPGRPNSPQGP